MACTSIDYESTSVRELSAKCECIHKYYKAFMRTIFPVVKIKLKMIVEINFDFYFIFFVLAFYLCAKILYAEVVQILFCFA